jgi:ADP-heptose:LPS heptosyltransferase
MKRYLRRSLSRGISAIGKAIVQLLGSLLVRPFVIWKRKSRSGNPEKPFRILYVCLAFRGDLVLNLPALAALKRRFPDSSLTCWVREYNRTLAETNPDIDEVLVYDSFRPYALQVFGELIHYLRHRDFLRSLRTKRFDICIDESGLAFSALMELFAGIPLRIGMSTQGFSFLYHYRFPYDEKTQLIEKRLRLLRPLGITVDDSDAAPRLRIPPEMLSAALRTAGLQLSEPGYFTVQPCGGWEAKNWSGDRFADVVSRFATATGLTPVFIGGRAEITRIDAIITGISTGALNLAGKMDLSLTAALISGAKLHLGVDSVGSHLAAAAGVKSLTIFGPTNPAISAHLSAGNVAVLKKVTCSPAAGNQYCFRDAGRTCPQFICMEQLLADDVFNALDDLWTGNDDLRIIVR